MCGLVGVLAYNELASKEEEKWRQEAMIFLSSELLQLTQPRGKDATGISTMFSNGDYIGLKMGIPALEFVARFGTDKTDYQGYLDIWRRKKNRAVMSIGHCRKPSTGTVAVSSDNNNNHPLKVGDIVGVHNGTLTNHERIFKNLDCGRDGKVDSEAIFRLLHHLTNKGTEPFSTQVIEETCKRLAGSYAVLAFNGNNPYQLAAFRDGRPLEVMVIRSLKLVLIASEKEILQTALYRYNTNAALYRNAVGNGILKKGDVVSKMLADDHLFLFDLRKDVTPETKPEDLYLEKKVDRLKKIWDGKGVKASTNKSYSVVGASNPHQPAGTAGSTPTGTTTQTATCTTNTNPARSGMVWDKDTNRYIAKQKKRAVKEHGNVTMDCSQNGAVEVVGETKKSSLAGTTDSKDIGLTETGNRIDSTYDSPAEIKEVKIEDGGTKKKPGEKQVDMTPTDPEVLGQAVKAAREYPSFSNIGELAEAIDIDDIDTMKSMALHSLANRIKRYFLTEGWVLGYLAAQPDTEVPAEGTSMAKYTRSMMARARKKLEKNKSTIRNLKNMMTVMDELIGDNCHPGEVQNAVERNVANNLELDGEALKVVLKPGDLRRMPNVNTIVQTLDWE